MSRSERRRASAVVESAPATLDELGRAADLGSLAHYEDPLYYAKTYAARRQDVAYYVRRAIASGGPVLEYGAGNGRVALPIARAGIKVVGVDLSRPMLQDFEQRLEREPREVRARVKLVQGDMRAVKLRQRFPLVIAPFNVTLHLYARSEIEAFLARVRQHLAPAGSFVFDVSVPQPGDLNRDPERRYRAPRFRDPQSGEWLRYSERFAYDPLRQLLLVTMEFEPEAGGPIRRVPLTHRQFFPRELEALLHYNGFSQIAFTADFSDMPATEETDSLQVSCRAKPSRLAGRPRRV